MSAAVERSASFVGSQKRVLQKGIPSQSELRVLRARLGVKSAKYKDARWSPRQDSITGQNHKFKFKRHQRQIWQPH